ASTGMTQRQHPISPSSWATGGQDDPSMIVDSPPNCKGKQPLANVLVASEFRRAVGVSPLSPLSPLSAPSPPPRALLSRSRPPPHAKLLTLLERNSPTQSLAPPTFSASPPR